jgi:hypothetical protein
MLNTNRYSGAAVRPSTTTAIALPENTLQDRSSQARHGTSVAALQSIKEGKLSQISNKQASPISTMGKIPARVSSITAWSPEMA